MTLGAKQKKKTPNPERFTNSSYNQDTEKAPIAFNLCRKASNRRKPALDRGDLGTALPARGTRPIPTHTPGPRGLPHSTGVDSGLFPVAERRGRRQPLSPSRGSGRRRRTASPSASPGRERGRPRPPAAPPPAHRNPLCPRSRRRRWGRGGEGLKKNF